MKILLPLQRSNTMIRNAPFFLICIIAFSLLGSCKKDQFNLGSDSKLVLRQDTLWFDTVFTKVNNSTPKSVNKQIIIVNPYDEKLKTNIRLAGGPASHFRLNVDGVPGHTFTDLELFPNDSLFLFVEVHPDPNNNGPAFNPLIIRDSVMFNTNGNEQKVNLIGWGQDAHYIFRDSIETDTTWANSALPIVVYGYLYVKPGAKLTIEKGMQVHYAPRSWLFVEGQVDIRGTVDDPILMQGDRLQPDWEETPGQWGGIWIAYPSMGNRIEHALIKNGTVGVYCDTISGDDNTTPNISIYKTEIRNMRFDGVAGRFSNIYMENSVSVNCGRFTLLANGGTYNIRHCTFHTGDLTFSRQDPTVAVLNTQRDEFSQIIRTYPLTFTMANSIAWGNLDFEFGLDLNDPPKYSLNLVTNNLKNSSFTNNNINQDPLFINYRNYDYQLDTLSPAKDSGSLLGISDDFLNRPRDSKPDIGAFESQF